MFRLLMICGLLANVSAALAVDVPFGADALPFNARKANLVVQAKSVTPLPAPEQPAEGRAAYNFYKCEVERVVDGKLTGNSLTFGLPKSLDLKSPEEYAGRMLFLQQVQSAEAHKLFPVPDDATVYQLVIGRLSAIDVTNGVRKDAIQNYLEVAKKETPSDAPNPPLSKERAEWCEKYVTDDDPWLQRSVVLELHRYSYDDKAVKMLGDVIKKESNTHELTRDAVSALQASGSRQALKPLKMVAEDTKLPAGLRSHAVKAIGVVPGGRDELEKWTSGSDKVLERSSKNEINRLKNIR